MKKSLAFLFLLLLTLPFTGNSQTSKKGKPLAELQQQFIDLRFGMFIH